MGERAIWRRMGRAEALESRPYLRTPGSRYPYLPAQERSGRDVFPKRPTYSEYTSRSQQFDGRLGEPSLPDKAGHSISLPSLSKNVQQGPFFRNVRLILSPCRAPSNSTVGSQ